MEHLNKAFNVLDNGGKGTVDLSRMLDFWLFTKMPIKSEKVNDSKGLTVCLLLLMTFESTCIDGSFTVLAAYGAVSKAATPSFNRSSFIDFALVLLDVCNLDIDAGCRMLAEELSKSTQVGERKT